MATSPVRASADKVPAGSHEQLTQAHQEATRLARALNAGLTLVSVLDLPDVRKKTIQLGGVLERIAEAERACGGCSELDHTFAKSYREMLEHHRLAYLDFERVARELTNNHSPSRGNVAALTSDLEHQLYAAETAHQASLQTPKPGEAGSATRLQIQV